MSAGKALFAALAVVAAACNRPEPRPASGELGVSAEGPDSAMTVQHRRLLAAATIALPPDDFPAESLPDQGSAGARMAVEFCTQCHAVAPPAMHGAVDWPAILRRMWVRIDMMRGQLGVRSPTEAERMQLLNYMIAHALQVPASLPDAPGREVFARMCSRCHVLPDPRIHSPADWPTVIVRMERNMERMRVSGLSSDQARSIITYLRAASQR